MSVFYRYANSDDFGHGEAMRHRSEIKKNLVALYARLKEQLAKLEDELRRSVSSRGHLLQSVAEILDNTLVLAENLNLLTEREHESLYPAYHKIAEELSRYLESAPQELDPGVCADASHPLYRRIFQLNMIASKDTRLEAKKCSSVSDIVHFIHSEIPNYGILPRWRDRERV